MGGRSQTCSRHERGCVDSGKEEIHSRLLWPAAGLGQARWGGEPGPCSLAQNCRHETDDWYAGECGRNPHPSAIRPRLLAPPPPPPLPSLRVVLACCMEKEWLVLPHRDAMQEPHIFFCSRCWFRVSLSLLLSSFPLPSSLLRI